MSLEVKNLPEAIRSVKETVSEQTRSKKEKEG
jgi:hypothetical protein